MVKNASIFLTMMLSALASAAPDDTLQVSVTQLRESMSTSTAVFGGARKDNLREFLIEVTNFGPATQAQLTFESVGTSTYANISLEAPKDSKTPFILRRYIMAAEPGACKVSTADGRSIDTLQVGTKTEGPDSMTSQIRIKTGLAAFAPHNAWSLNEKQFQVILGPISKLDDASVKALASYVAGGGTCLFSQDSIDPRWQRLIDKLGTPQSSTVKLSAPLKTGKVGYVQVASTEWQLGLGHLVQLKDSQAIEMATGAAISTPPDKDNMLSPFENEVSGNTWQTAPRINAEPQPTNPFQASAPPAGTVVGVLTLYVFAILGMLVLFNKRFKKGESSWIAAPVLSVAFAGVFFSFSRSLGTFKDGYSQTAKVIGDVRTGHSVAWGNAEFFSQKQQKVDLSGPGLEVVRIPDRTKMPLDISGDHPAPKVEFTNRSFKSFNFQSAPDVSGWMVSSVRISV